MKVTLENLDQSKEFLDFFKLEVVKRAKNLAILTQRFTGRRFVVGKIKCPYCNQELELFIVRHDTPTRPSVQQMDSDFKNHMDSKHSKEFDKEWIHALKEPYQPGSWHIVKKYMCRKCGFKSRRYVDVLIHLITEHNFGVET